jgi:hypothetical protein
MGVKVAFRGDGASNHVSASVGSGGVWVPAAAIRQADGRDVVWVVRNERLERRAVKWVKGPREAEAEVQAGLNGGERVVVEGPAALAEGSRVTEKKP